MSRYLPHLLSARATTPAQVEAVREAVATYAGHVSQYNARIDNVEVRGAQTWITIAVSDAEHAFFLGQKVGQLLGQEGGVELG